MQYNKRDYDPILLASLNMLGVASLLGFLYCAIVLFSGATNFDNTDVALYMVWFGMSALSVYVMRLGDIWGAFALGIATVAITIYDFVRGMATFEGAMLGALVMIIIYFYITTTTSLFTQETHQRI